MNLPYVNYYIDLENKFVSSVDCSTTMTNNFKTEWENKIKSCAIEDSESKLGTYFQINPLLISPISNQQNLLEVERILVTRYRTGSHSLAIEMGRFTKPLTPREERMCKCKTSVQTIFHCFNNCPITTPYITKNLQIYLIYLKTKTSIEI